MGILKIIHLFLKKDARSYQSIFTFELRR